jgi:hypothetical protein
MFVFYHLDFENYFDRLGKLLITGLFNATVSTAEIICGV